MSQGYTDIFLVSFDKDTPTSTYWVKYIGTSSHEYGNALTILKDGSVFALGQIKANGYTNGDTDMLLMKLDINGNTLAVEYLGGTSGEQGEALVWNGVAGKVAVFASTKSTSYKN